MTDRLIRLHRNPLTGPIVRALGLPRPVELARAAGPYLADAFGRRNALLIALDGGYAHPALRTALTDGAATLVDEQAAAFDIVVCDATGCRAPADMRRLYEAFHPRMRQIARNGR